VTAARCWLDREPHPGWHNMAVDAALLELAEAGLATIRLYRWRPACLSFGRHEPAGRRYDRRRIEELGLDCVRRPTGGRAVWHAGELTYAVAAPPDSLGNLQEAYRAIHQWLQGALGRLGVEATLAPRRSAPGPGAGPCFAAAVGGEIVVRGRKVLGSAQRRGTGGAFLQHGSLLLDDDQSQVRAVLAGPATGLAGDAEPPEAPLGRLLARPVAFEEAAAAIAAELEARGLPAFQDVPPNDVTARAPLHYPRFQSKAWTWER